MAYRFRYHAHADSAADVGERETEAVESPEANEGEAIDTKVAVLESLPDKVNRENVDSPTETPAPRRMRFRFES